MTFLFRKRIEFRFCEKRCRAEKLSFLAILSLSITCMNMSTVVLSRTCSLVGSVVNNACVVQFDLCCKIVVGGR